MSGSLSMDVEAMDTAALRELERARDARRPPGVHLRVDPIEYDRLHVVAQILADERAACEFNSETYFRHSEDDPEDKWHSGIKNLFGEAIYAAIIDALRTTKTRTVHVDRLERHVEEIERVWIKT